MVQCRTIFSVIGFVLLLFFGIPIRIDPPDTPLNKTLTLFENYIEKYNKTYQHNETLRYEKYIAFQTSLEEISRLNSQRKHNTSAVYGITKFSDMSKDEFVEIYLQEDMHARISNRSINFKDKEHSKEDISHEMNVVKRSLQTLPRKVDWRTKNAVTKVYNQKNCGACWAFSAVETIESMKAIKYNILEPLSVQELIDCAQYSNDGCNGGDICALLYWIYDNNIKISKDVEYPLHLKTETCKFDAALSGVEISDFSCDSYVNQEDLILNLLAYHGPVAVAINAMLWQNYLGGVIQFHCDPSSSLLNHAVQIIGYDLTAEIPFYIVRNSWGRDFGDHGYLNIAIGNNVCGLAHEVLSLDIF